MSTPLKRGRPPKGDRAMTSTERCRAHRAWRALEKAYEQAAEERNWEAASEAYEALKNPAAGISNVPSAVQPSWTDDDAKLVSRLKRTARGEWLDLCELAERLMRP